MPNDVQDAPQTIDDVLGPEPTIDEVLGPERNNFPSDAVIGAPARPRMVSTTEGGPQRAGPNMRPLTKSDFTELVPDEVKEGLTRPVIPIPKFTVDPQGSRAAAFGKTAANMAVSIPEFLESPLGAVTAIGTGGGGLLGRLVAAGFSAQAAKSVYDQQKDLREKWPTLTPAQKTAAITEIGGTSALALGAGHGAVKGMPAAKAEIPPEIAAAAKVLPRAAAEVAKIEPQPKESNASSEQKTTEIHGDVRPLEEPPGALPSAGGGGGVQPQASGGIQEEGQPTGPRPETLRPAIKVNGKVYPAVVNGFYDLSAVGKGTVPSVGRWDGKGWSHGMLKLGEEIVTPGVTPEAFEKFKSGTKAPESGTVEAPGATKTTKTAPETPKSEPAAPKNAPAPTPASRRIPSTARPLDVLDAVESTGKINIASARKIREGYNPPPAARKLFDFKNESTDIDKVLQGVREHPTGEFAKLGTEDNLLDAIDNAGPARQGMRQQSAREGKQAQLDLETSSHTPIGQQLEDWADSKIKAAQGRLSAGLDPELLTAYAIKGARIIQRGISDFAKWSREMIQQFGEDIKPHLADIFDRAKAHHASMGDVAYGKEEPGHSRRQIRHRRPGA